jgi:hypothetical protein
MALAARWPARLIDDDDDDLVYPGERYPLRLRAYATHTGQESLLTI